jgi:CheY-like chemotaxis protein
MHVQELLSILAVGISERTGLVQALPVRFVSVEQGRQALQHLRTEAIDLLISQWEVSDMAAGELLIRIRRAKPYVPILAVVQGNNPDQEIAARGIGANVVLPDDVNDEQLGEIVCRMLGLRRTELVRTGGSGTWMQ